jgi:hypothetical protein
MQVETIVETIEDAISQEPEDETQPGTTQPDDAATETQLTLEISDLWGNHVRLSADRKATAKDLRQIRAILAERLFAMKSVLSRPGRGGQWRSWLRERGINRSTADRLCDRHAETLGIENGNAPSEAISNSQDESAEKLARVVWARFRKFLVSDEVVIDFIDRIAELAGVGHEQRAEGLVIFKPAPKAAEGLPATAPIIDPAPQPSGTVPATTEEPREDTTATPTEVGLAVAAAETSNGDVV